MEHMADAPTHRLLHIAAIYMEMESPIPVDLILTLNSRGIIFNQDEEDAARCLE